LNVVQESENHMLTVTSGRRESVDEELFYFDDAAS